MIDTTKSDATLAKLEMLLSRVPEKHEVPIRAADLRSLAMLQDSGGTTTSWPPPCWKHKR
jgi:hypothetical protein